MQHLRSSFLAGAVLAALPLAALISGCGGGGGSNSPSATATPVATATPRATATPTPTSISGALTTFKLTAAAGANGTTLSTYQKAITGTQTVTKTDVKFTLSSILRQPRSPGADVEESSETFEFVLSGSQAFHVGDSFTVGGVNPTATVVLILKNGSFGVGNPFVSTYSGTSGQFTITSLSANSITVRFDDVVIRGPLTLNGTVTSKLP